MGYQILKTSETTSVCLCACVRCVCARVCVRVRAKHSRHDHLRSKYWSEDRKETFQSEHRGADASIILKQVTQ
jgi:hypothetical protein